MPNEIAKPIAVTVASARKASGLGTTTIYALMKEGKLKTKLIGRRRLILYASLEELLLGGGEAA